MPINIGIEVLDPVTLIPLALVLTPMELMVGASVVRHCYYSILNK
jgi:hypothetical protein